MMAGRRFYENSLGNGRDSNTLLRRNIHRLEKGLIARPQKSSFAIEYIGETVSAYENLLRQGGPSASEELSWAHDVLKEYFSRADANPIFLGSRERFSLMVSFCYSDRESSRIPMPRGNSVTPVDYEALLLLAKRRRSVRLFEPVSVDREKIEKALEVARLSPSACNRQPFQFLIFDDRDLVRRISVIPMGTVGFHENFPMIVVIVGQLRAFPFERDRHVIYIDASLAAMAFMLALETLELSSCPINWPDISDREIEINKVLKLAPDERVIMLIAVGRADPLGKIASSIKRPLDQIRRYNLGQGKGLK